MARTKNQTERRRELISAAQRAIATRGLGALRLKDVAEEAGLTGPAVSYYYPDLDELLMDVYERQIDSYIEEAPKAIAGVDSPWGQIQAAVLYDLAEGPDDVDSIIMYQFAGEPRFSRNYRTLSAALHTTQIGIYRSIVDTGTTLGHFAPSLESHRVAGAIVALADAYGLQVVIGEPGMTKEVAHTEICAVAGDLLRVKGGVKTRGGEFGVDTTGS